MQYSVVRQIIVLWDTNSYMISQWLGHMVLLLSSSLKLAKHGQIRTILPSPVNPDKYYSCKWAYAEAPIAESAQLRVSPTFFRMVSGS